MNQKENFYSRISGNNRKLFYFNRLKILMILFLLLLHIFVYKLKKKIQCYYKTTSNKSSKVATRCDDGSRYKHT